MPPKRRRRKGKPVQISQALTAVMRRISRGQQGVHPEIWARWGDIVGSDLSKRAFPRRLKDSVLVVAVSSSAWMQELSYIKVNLIEKIGQEVGPDIVSDIRFVLDTALPSSLLSEKTASSEHHHAGKRSLEVDNAINTIEDDELRDVINRAVKANLRP
jgi:hypothetical protein